jgi:NADH dehydrogenase subunit L (EC 1.6.5.3)
MKSVYLLVVLAPLVGAAVAGLAGGFIGRANAHRLTVGAVGIAALLSLWVLYQHTAGGLEPYNPDALPVGKRGRT